MHDPLDAVNKSDVRDRKDTLSDWEKVRDHFGILLLEELGVGWGID